MDKYIYHGGRRTLGESAQVSLEKNQGNDQFSVKIDCSSTASGMDALEAIVRAYEQWLGVPAHHVLAVLATVMTVPCGQIENVSALGDQMECDAEQLLERPIVGKAMLQERMCGDEQV